MSKYLIPYFDVWFKTRETVEGIREGRIVFNPHYPILISTGFSAINARMIGTFWGDALMILIFVLTGYLVFARLFPIILIRIGKLWNGQADFDSMQKVLGLSQIPAFLGIFYQLVYLLADDVWLYEYEISYAIQFLITFFYVKILVIGISKVQRFGYGFAVMSIVLIAIPLIVLKLGLQGVV